MADIKVILKPDSIPYDKIHDVLLKAHKNKKKNGMTMRNVSLSGEEIKEKIGKDGKCYVALDGEKIVGTASYRIRTINKWYHKGKTAEFILSGILPEYRGKHIFPQLEEIRIAALKEAGINTIQFDTAENNARRQEIAKKVGYYYVDFFASHSNHYSVEMFRWLDKPPFSKGYCALRYHLKKIYIKTRFKPGKIKRFGI